MPLFSRNREAEVHGFILKLVNNNCADIDALVEGPRLDRRVNLTVVVLVIPLEKGILQTRKAFTATTKEFSSGGLALVLDEPRALDEVIFGFRWESEMIFLRAGAKHLNPMGGGFYQLGFRLTGTVHTGDYPELEWISL